MARRLQSAGMRYRLHTLCQTVLVASVVLWASVPAVRAATPDCESLAAASGAARGLPEGLLPAIARTESGLLHKRGSARAWPWTLNVQGKGLFFESREKALAHLRKVVASGVRNVDVGCMQINYRWHGSHFSSLEEMLDPRANTAYAADLMSRLYVTQGDWAAATAHYHSADAARGAAYVGRVRQRLARLAKGDLSQPAVIVAADPVPRALPGPARVPAPIPADNRFHGSAPLIAVSNPAPDLSETTMLPQGALPRLDRARAILMGADRAQKIAISEYE